LPPSVVVAAAFGTTRTSNIVPRVSRCSQLIHQPTNPGIFTRLQGSHRPDPILRSLTTAIQCRQPENVARSLHSSMLRPPIHHLPRRSSGHSSSLPSNPLTAFCCMEDWFCRATMFSGTSSIGLHCDDPSELTRTTQTTAAFPIQSGDAPSSCLDLSM